MQNIEITTTCAVEIDGKEYQAKVSATVYPAHAATRDDDGGCQVIEIDSISIVNPLVIWALFPSLAKIDTTENYDRCIMAVQNEIESQLN